MLPANLNSHRKIFLLMLIQKGDNVFLYDSRMDSSCFHLRHKWRHLWELLKLGAPEYIFQEKKKKILTHELIEMAFQHCWWAFFISTVLPASFTFLTKLSEKGRFFSYFPCRVKCLFSPTVLICKTNSFIESRRQLSCCWKKGLKA